MTSAEATVDVVLGSDRIPIERRVLTTLFDNSIVNSRAPYRDAQSTSRIAYSDLVKLARDADIPHALFFAPYEVVQGQVDEKNRRLLDGLTKREFSMNARASVKLADIELLIRDLLRKQETLKSYDKTLTLNPVAGRLRRRRSTPIEEARKLESILGMSSATLRLARTKAAAVDILITRLEANQVLVSQSQSTYMPQSLRNLKFSGLTIKDNKVPYVFLAGADDGESPEPDGRRLFTLTLMSVLIARAIFAPVTFSGHAGVPDDNREYAIAAEILMPTADFRQMDVSSLTAVREAADLFKVTPSAAVVRSMRLGLLSHEVGRGHLDVLRAEYRARPKSKGGRTSKPVNGVRKYSGAEFSRRMLTALDGGKLGAKEFCRTACLNRISPSQIAEFRAALG